MIRTVLAAPASLLGGSAWTAGRTRWCQLDCTTQTVRTVLHCTGQVWEMEVELGRVRDEECSAPPDKVVCRYYEGQENKTGEIKLNSVQMFVHGSVTMSRTDCSLFR